MRRIPIIRYVHYTLMLMVSIVFYGCGIYSFNDASIPVEVKTIKINFFNTKAVLSNPTINLLATNEFRTKVQNQTKLLVVNNEARSADYEISADITNYNIVTSGISGNQAAKNLLRLDINYIFTNHLEAQIPQVKSAEFNCSVQEEFDAKTNFSSIENATLTRLVDQITNQAFNKIFSTW